MGKIEDISGLNALSIFLHCTMVWPVPKLEPKVHAGHWGTRKNPKMIFSRSPLCCPFVAPDVRFGSHYARQTVKTPHETGQPEGRTPAKTPRLTGTVLAVRFSRLLQ
jgi:hypothetical protein